MNDLIMERFEKFCSNRNLDQAQRDKVMHLIATTQDNGTWTRLDVHYTKSDTTEQIPIVGGLMLYADEYRWVYGDLPANVRMIEFKPSSRVEYDMKLPKRTSPTIGENGYVYRIVDGQSKVFYSKDYKLHEVANG